MPRKKSVPASSKKKKTSSSLTVTSTPISAPPPSLGSARVATVAEVHETTEGMETIDLTPPHPPRVETPEYARAHHFLVYEKKAPCQVCGVTIDTVASPDEMETHHFPIERSFADACDPTRVHRDFPTVYDLPTLLQFVDSPANLLVLCTTHHRSKQHGIHHLSVMDFTIQKYLRPGYIIATDEQGLASAIAIDTQIETAAGLEPVVVPVAAPLATAPVKRPRKPRTRRKPTAAA